MVRSGSTYERELKELLQGDARRVRAYARQLDPSDRSEFEEVIDRPFLVVRAAGSLGFDLVALRREFAFPLEVKASTEATFRFSAASGRAAEQLAAHREAVQRVGLIVLYAYRRIGLRSEEPWRVFSASRPVSDGLLGVLARRLPPVEATRDGNAILRWETGMRLSRFLTMFRFLVDSVPEGAR